MGYYEDVYSSPEKHGLEIVATIEWDDEDYQFDMTVVWKEKATGRLFMASDSGCSCPSPFEDYRKVEDLTPLTEIGQVEALVRENREDRPHHAPTPKDRCDDFLAAVRTELRNWKRRGK